MYTDGSLEAPVLRLWGGGWTTRLPTGWQPTHGTLTGGRRGTSGSEEEPTSAGSNLGSMEQYRTSSDKDPFFINPSASVINIKISHQTYHILFFFIIL